MRTSTVETGELSRLPAGPILVRLRRVLLTGAGAAWLFLIPHESLTSGGTIVFPFPFSAPELTITHNP